MQPRCLRNRQTSRTLLSALSHFQRMYAFVISPPNFTLLNVSLAFPRGILCRYRDGTRPQWHFPGFEFHLPPSAACTARRPRGDSRLPDILPVLIRVHAPPSRCGREGLFPEHRADIRCPRYYGTQCRATPSIYARTRFIS